MLCSLHVEPEKGQNRPMQYMCLGMHRITVIRDERGQLILINVSITKEISYNLSVIHTLSSLLNKVSAPSLLILAVHL